jgi:hypothetical protein
MRFYIRLQHWPDIYVDEWKGLTSALSAVFLLLSIGDFLGIGPQLQQD